MARLTITAGNVEAARQYVDAARAIVNELVAEEHDDVFTNLNVLETWQASGRLNLLSGDPVAARREFEEALARAERLIEATTERNTWLEYVAESYDGIGDSAYYQKDFEKAAESYSKALAIRDSLAIKVPDNVMWRLQQAVSAYKLALLESHVGGETSTRARNQALVLFNRLDSDGHLPAPVRLTLDQVESYRP
jgi:tetratricopeptide (TPR) repeat protein